jgi:integrase
MPTHGSRPCRPTSSVANGDHLSRLVRRSASTASEPSFGTVPLGKLRPEDWRTWHATALAQCPGSTQPGGAYRLARAILSTAVDDGRLRANPCRVHGAGREQAGELPIVMPDDVLKIAEAIDGRHRAMVMLAAFCSLRTGGLAGLRRARVDLLHRTIRVEENGVELGSGRVVFGPPKTDAGRRAVVIPKEVVPLIENHLEEYVGPDPSAPAFTSPEGHALRRTKFRSKCVDACSTARLAGLHFHDLRGSGATWAAHAGANVAELMARLGHTTPNMAMRYRHATTERDQAISDRLGALMEDAARSAAEEPVAAVIGIDR